MLNILLDQKLINSMRLLPRLASVLLVFLLALNIFTPDPHSWDILTYDGDKGKRTSPHINRLLTHQEGLNSNSGYLETIEGNSVTRDNPTDIGMYVWQANLKLARQIFSRGPSTLSYKDFSNIQAFFISVTLALFILLRFDFVAVVLSTVALVVSKAGLINPLSVSSWSVVPCIVTALVLLFWLCKSMKKEDVDRWDYISLLVLSTMGGVLGSFRASGAILIEGTFWLILGLIGTSLCIKYPDQTKERFKHIYALIISRVQVLDWKIVKKRDWDTFKNELKSADKLNGLPRIFLLSLTIVLGISFVAPTIQYINIAAYELVDDSTHQSKMGGRHTKWGPLYAGLGHSGAVPPYRGVLNRPEAPFWNGENIYWNDSAVRLMVSKEQGQFFGWDQSYENASRNSFFRILFYNTPLVAKIYFYRLRAIILEFAQYFLFAIGGLVAIVCVSFRSLSLRSMTGVIWTSGCVMMAFLSALPVLGAVSRFHAFIYAATSIGLFSFVFLFWLLSAREDLKSDLKPFFRSLHFLLIGILALGLCFMLRVSYVESHRDQLLAELKLDEISLPELFNNYHADAVDAFNNLDHDKRAKLALTVAGTDSELRKNFIEVKSEDILFVDYKNDTIFTLLKVDERFDQSRVFPIQMLFKENNFNMTTDVMALPFRVEPGVWMMSFRMPQEHVNGAVIKNAEQYNFGIYKTPENDLK